MKTFLSLILCCLMAAPAIAVDFVSTQVVPNSPGTSLVASRVISTRPCKVFSIIVLNTLGSTQYIQVHETTSLPANGVAPKIPSFAVATGTSVVINFGPAGIDLDALTICNSSTTATKTIGSADCMISAVIAAR